MAKIGLPYAKGMKGEVFQRVGQRRKEELRVELVSVLSYMGFNNGSIRTTIKGFIFTFSAAPIQLPRKLFKKIKKFLDG
ncbi:hypothetical protein PanWU01x14_170670 [Parasponia andersonii]|uniref:Uncharacterized protein n=1 Tax=Parasponia andersonii TaxID=3476 RepID=A0A2P5CA34_PARAD|nr:hypothetical protein PanWU01x14_170670 [Parasponia andersonii]